MEKSLSIWSETVFENLHSAKLELTKVMFDFVCEIAVTCSRVFVGISNKTIVFHFFVSVNTALISLFLLKIFHFHLGKYKFSLNTFRRKFYFCLGKYSIRLKTLKKMFQFCREKHSINLNTFWRNMGPITILFEHDRLSYPLIPFQIQLSTDSAYTFFIQY